jgi:hypothetical protein
LVTLSCCHGESCFASCPHGNSFSVRWCATSLLPLCSCLAGEGLSWLIRRCGLFPNTFVHQIWLSGVFLLGFCGRHCLSWKSTKCKWVVWQLLELLSALPMKYLPVCGKKLNIVLMCVVPVMVPILIPTEHINFLRSNVWKCVFSNAVNDLKNIYIILFPFKAGHL